jgi:hypothetical protein
MGMKIDIKSQLWYDIYHNIKRYYDPVDYVFRSRQEMEELLESLHIKIEKDIDPIYLTGGRWVGIEIDLEDEELMLFLLKWG